MKEITGGSCVEIIVSNLVNTLFFGILRDCGTAREYFVAFSYDGYSSSKM